MVKILLSVPCENRASAWGQNKKGANNHIFTINMTLALNTIVSVGGHSNRDDCHINSVKSTAFYTYKQIRKYHCTPFIITNVNISLCHYVTGF